MFLTPRGSVFDEVMSHLEEVEARCGPVIAIASAGDPRAADCVARVADEVVFVLDVPEYLQPVVASRPPAAVRLPHGRVARVRRRQAPQPGQVLTVE